MRTTTAAIVVRNNTILLGRRKPGGSIGGKWEFPGGKVRYRERPEEALARELAEELGASARVGRLLGSVEFDHDTEHFQLIAYEASISRILNTPMHDEIRWVAMEELPSLDLAESDRRLARRLGLIGG